MQNESVIEPNQEKLSFSLWMHFLHVINQKLVVMNHTKSVCVRVHACAHVCIRMHVCMCLHVRACPCAHPSANTQEIWKLALPKGTKILDIHQEAS